MRQCIQKQRIGIVGGMGPMAGVLLQKLIIEATPAERDQDHIPVICFTNPQIPDRTASLQNDGGARFMTAVKESVEILIRAGATILVIPCNTAHAQFSEIQQASSVPILNLITMTLDFIVDNFDSKMSIGILTTEGMREAAVFQNIFKERGIQYILPSALSQKRLTEIIYDIKAGRYVRIEQRLTKVIKTLRAAGAEVILLGCTELSLYTVSIKHNNNVIVDPLRIAAECAVRMLKKPSIGMVSPNIVQPARLHASIQEK